MNRIRAFVALTLPIELVERAAELQGELRRAAEGRRIAWVPPANMHVTLKFLGEVPEESVPAIDGALRPRLGRLGPLSLAVRGVGAFPKAGPPRVLWLGLSADSDALTVLAGEVQDALDGIGFPRDKRAFSPHLTLGRVKEGGDRDLIAPFADRDLGSCKAGEVVLYKSVLQRKGSEYFTLHRYRLRAGRG